MTKEEIRLQYSGFIIFATKMLSVGTGLLFQIMIARTVTQSQYDVWFNLNDVLRYFTLLAAAVPFWTMRSVARDQEDAVKTGVIANLIIAAVATLIYLPLVPFMTSWLGIRPEHVLLYFLISTQIIELYAVNVLQRCLQATKPQAIGYGLLVSETCKVVLGYILIIKFQFALLGALISLLVGYAIQTGYYLTLFGGEWRGQVRWGYIKEWLKGSMANIYNVIGGRISTFIFILLFMYGGEGGRGRYGLSRTVASVITYSSFLAFALHPKLLAERRREDITNALRMVLMFAIPMTAGAIVLSDSYVIIMKSIYRDAWPVLIVLAVNGFILTMSNLFKYILFGLERVDEKAEISLSELVKSRLFLAFSLPYLKSAIALPTAFLVLTHYAHNQPVQSAFYVSLINTSAGLVTFLVLYALVHRTVHKDIPWKNITKYALASVIMAIFLLLIPHPTRISLTLLATGAGGIVYLTLLTIIDREARILIRSIWQEIISMLRGILG